MQESLSALIDGELDAEAVNGALGRLRAEPGLEQCWADYHLIGDVLRSGAPPLFDTVRFREVLAAEPTVFTPRASRWLQPVPVRRALSAAVAAGAVAFVGWIAWPTLTGAPAANLAKEGLPAGRVAAAAGIPQAHGVEDYLLAHQYFSPSFAMHGTAPYVRLVDSPAAGDKQ